MVDCSICMCAVTGEEDAASLDKCTHAFHFACIVKWGETTNQCPMCKVRYCGCDSRLDVLRAFRVGLGSSGQSSEDGSSKHTVDNCKPLLTPCTS